MRKVLLVLGFFWVATLGETSAGEKAWYGFHIKPELAGFPLNPVVVSVVIDQIKPGSPASLHHIQVGDTIIEAEGHKVPGARALQLLGILSKQPGETLHLRFLRPNGETYRVEIIGIRKPTS